MIFECGPGSIPRISPSGRRRGEYSKQGEQFLQKRRVNSMISVHTSTVMLCNKPPKARWHPTQKYLFFTHTAAGQLGLDRQNGFNGFGSLLSPKVFHLLWTESYSTRQALLMMETTETGEQEGEHISSLWTHCNLHEQAPTSVGRGKYIPPPLEFCQKLFLNDSLNSQVFGH